MAKQMEFFCNQAGLERLQQAERRLSAGCYRQSSEEHSPNGMSLDNADGQGIVASRHLLAAGESTRYYATVGCFIYVSPAGY